MNNDDVSDDDKKLFRHMMKDVKPLKASVKKEARDTPFQINTPTRRENNPLTELSIKTLYLSDYFTQSVQSESILTHNPHSIPSQQFKQLKAGKIPWEARLDLHGLDLELARESLSAFIQLQYQSSSRCLLIIHGKGGKRGEEPILKNLVNHWLKQFPQILAFHSAIPKDGGAGALYVLLKRLRS
jgi:DNA-nicking Smr family endonuclease